MIDKGIIESLKNVTRELESIAVAESRTQLFRLHLSLQNILNYLERLGGENASQSKPESV